MQKLLLFLHLAEFHIICSLWIFTLCVSHTCGSFSCHIWNFLQMTSVVTQNLSPCFLPITKCPITSVLKLLSLRCWLYERVSSANYFTETAKHRLPTSLLPPQAGKSCWCSNKKRSLTGFPPMNQWMLVEGVGSLESNYYKHILYA